jgi:ABC-2 type transport system ATP-binding protein
MSSDRVIEVKNLEKIYRSGTHAVKGISFEVNKGEIFGILGPNGAGKTTALQMMGTLLKITKGDISILGYDIHTDEKKIREKIGFALQEAGLDNLATTSELITFHINLFGFPKSVISKKVEESLTLLDLHDYADQMIPELSGGTQRRLDLAVSLVHNPELLILDEPTTGLDPVHRADLWNLLRKLRDERGLTLVLSTHYMEEADVLCDRIAIIDSGEIVAIDTPDKLKKSVGKDTIEFSLSDEIKQDKKDALALLFGDENLEYSGERLLIRVNDGETSLLPTLKNIIDLDIKVKGTKVKVPTLDDVYLKYTGKRLEDA